MERDERPAELFLAAALHCPSCETEVLLRIPARHDGRPLVPDRIRCESCGETCDVDARSFLDRLAPKSQC